MPIAAGIQQNQVKLAVEPPQRLGSHRARVALLRCWRRFRQARQSCVWSRPPLRPAAQHYGAPMGRATRIAGTPRPRRIRERVLGLSCGHINISPYVSSHGTPVRTAWTLGAEALVRARLSWSCRIVDGISVIGGISTTLLGVRQRDTPSQ